MNCPKCAAPVTAAMSKTHAVCEYCRCFVPLATDRANKDRVTRLSESTTHVCPDCDVPLYGALVDGQAVETCPDCQSLLLSRDVLHSVIQDRRANYSGAEDSVPVDQTALMHQRLCPECQQAMETHVYFGPGNSVIDSCHGCDLVWLNHGELTQIETAPGRRAVAAAASPEHYSQDEPTDMFPQAGGQPLVFDFLNVVLR